MCKGFDGVCRWSLRVLLVLGIGIVAWSVRPRAILQSEASWLSWRAFSNGSEDQNQGYSETEASFVVNDGHAVGHVIVKLASARSLTDSERQWCVASGMAMSPLDGQGLWLARFEGISVDEAISALTQSLTDIAFAEPDYVIDSAEFPTSFPVLQSGGFWHLHEAGQSGVDINAPEAWDVQPDAEGIVVAVIDSGVDTDHPDLERALLPGTSFVPGESTVEDASGHGTHVMGIIAATADRSEPFVRQLGIAQGAKVLPLKVLNRSGQGLVSAAVAAMDEALAQGADVINLSWTTAGESAALGEALERARAAGAICIVPSGNQGRSLDVLPRYPAAYGYDHVVVVASHGRDAALSSFSNTSETLVTLAAPGEGIRSTSLDAGAAVRSGTSMAAAQVTGVLALMQAKYPQRNYQEQIDHLLGGSHQELGYPESMLHPVRLDASGALLAREVLPPFRDREHGFLAGKDGLIRWPISTERADREGRRERWCQWTSADLGRKISIRLLRGDLDGTIHIYQLGEGGQLTELGNDAVGSVMEIDIENDTNYALKVSSSLEEAGFGVLEIYQGPTNDDMTAPALLEEEIVNVTTTTVGATRAADEPLHAGTTGNGSLWWQWTAPRSGFYQLATRGSDFDTAIAVYDGLPASRNVFGSVDEVVFTIDVSTSSLRSFGGGGVGDLNGDDQAGTVLDAQIAIAETLLDLLLEESPKTRVRLVEFNTEASLIDLDPELGGVQETVLADMGEDLLRTALRGRRVSVQGSNIESALVLVLDGLRQGNVETAEVVLLSDGQQTRGGPFDDDARALREQGYGLRSFVTRGGADLVGFRDANVAPIAFGHPAELSGLRWNVVAANDDINVASRTSEVVFQAEEGKIYYFAFDGVRGEQGDLVVGGQYLPEFELPESPGDQTLRLGEKLVLEVEAVTSDSLDYQWFKDGVPIPRAVFRRVVLGPAELEDAGRYSVFMSDGVQSFPGPSFDVVIDVAAPLIVDLQRSYTLAPSQSEYLIVSIDTFGLFTTVRWFRDGVALPELGKGNLLYFIDSATATDAGVYHAEFTNALGTTKSPNIEVTVVSSGMVWEQVRPSVPVDDFSAGTVIDGTWLLGTQTGGIYWSSDGGQWSKATVETGRPPNGAGGFVPRSIRFFDSIGERSYAFIGGRGISAREGEQGGWFSDDLRNWQWDPTMPFLEKLMVFGDRVVGVQNPSSSDTRLFDYADGEWRPIEIPLAMQRVGPPVQGSEFALSLSDSGAYISTDGLEWVKKDEPPWWGDFFFQDDRFHIIDLDRRKALSSSDGEQWDERSIKGRLSSQIVSSLVSAREAVLFTESEFSWSDDLDSWENVSVAFRRGIIGGFETPTGVALYGWAGSLWTGSRVGSARPSSSNEDLRDPYVVDGALYAFPVASTNGSLWTSDEGPSPFGPIVFGGGRYVRISFDGIEHSLDRSTWSRASVPDAFQGSGHVSLAFGEGTFVAAHEDGGILRSTDGITWEEVMAQKVNFTRLGSTSFVNGRFYALGADLEFAGEMWHSPDGREWSPSAVPGSDEPQAIAFTSGIYVITTNRGNVWRSTDGENWEVVELSFQVGQQSLRTLVSVPGRFASLGRDRVITSTNGRDWLVETFRNVHGLASFKGNFYLVGQQGLVLRTQFGGSSEPSFDLAMEVPNDRSILVNDRIMLSSQSDSLVDIVEIVYYVNGEALGEAVQPPFEPVEWRVRNFGKTTILAEARTRAGETVTSTLEVDVELPGLGASTSALPGYGGLAELFVVDDVYVGFGEGDVRRSSDGLRWERQSLALSEGTEAIQMASVGGGKWFVTFASGALAVTEDSGANWSEVESVPELPFERARWAGLAAQQGTIVLVGTDLAENEGSIIYSSRDGIEWQEVMRLDGWASRLSTWEQGFIMGTNTEDYRAQSVTSTDGQTWIVSDPLEGSFREIVVGNGVALLQSSVVGEGLLTYRSSTGLTWERLNGDSHVILGNGGGGFLGFVIESGLYAQSIDGIDWTSVPGTEEIRLRYSNNRYLYGPAGWISYGQYYAIATDVAQWREFNTPEPQGSKDVYASATDGDRLVIAGAGGNVSLTDDGVTWLFSNVDAGAVIEAVYGNGRFVLFGGAGQVFTSVDGVNWEEESFFEEVVQEAAFADGHFVAIGGGRVQTSVDGKSWIASESFLPFVQPRVAYGKGRWIVGGPPGIVGHSLDGGLTWEFVELQPTGRPAPIDYVTFSDERFQVGNDFGCFESVDGENWSVASCEEHPVNFATGVAKWSHGWGEGNDADLGVYLALDGRSWALAAESGQHIATLGGDVFVIHSFESIRKLSLVDISGSDLVASADRGAGDLMQVSLALRNEGYSDLREEDLFRIEFGLRLTGNAAPSSNLFLGSVLGPQRIEAGGVVTIKAALEIPSGLDPGDYELYAMIDREDIVSELNPTNNTVVAEELFSVATRQLEIAAFGNGSLTLDLGTGQTVFRALPGESYRLSEEAMVQMQAIPAPGYQLVGWLGSDFAATSPLPITLNEDRFVGPVFVPQATVTYGSWISGHFEDEEASFAAQDADPDADGRPNLLEFALGSDPRQANRLPPLKVSRNSGTVAIDVSYHPAHQVDLVLQESADLHQWSEARVMIKQATTTEDRASLRLRPTMSGQKARYYRLRVGEWTEVGAW